MVNPNAKKPAPITSAAGASLGPMLGTAAEYQKTLLFPQHNLIRRGMRGKDEQQLDVFSYISPEQRVPQDHPLRSLRAMADEALQQLQPRFNRLYAKTGRPSIAPEKLLRALLLQALYSVRSERLLMEQLDYNLLFRWFVGLNMD